MKKLRELFTDDREAVRKMIVNRIQKEREVVYDGFDWHGKIESLYKTNLTYVSPTALADLLIDLFDEFEDKKAK